jgi:hypothetical protein
MQHHGVHYHPMNLPPSPSPPYLCRSFYKPFVINNPPPPPSLILLTCDQRRETSFDLTD